MFISNISSHILAIEEGYDRVCDQHFVKKYHGSDNERLEMSIAISLRRFIVAIISSHLIFSCMNDTCNRKLLSVYC